MDYAVYLWNRMPKKDGANSPEEIFYSIKSDHSAIREAKCWGCPAYVLDPKLQDGKKLPRWNPRSKLGQFLGRSKKHAGSVGLIRNLGTGKISPQYHVVYDNHFTTVDSITNLDNVPVPDGFDKLVKTATETIVDPYELEQNKQKTKTKRSSSQRRLENEGVEPPITETVRNESSVGDNVGTTPPVEHEASTPVTSNRSGGDEGRLEMTRNETTEEHPQSGDDDSNSDVTENIGDTDNFGSSSDEDETKNRRYPVRNTRNKNPNYVFFEEAYVNYLQASGDVDCHELFLMTSDLTSGSDSITKQYDLLNLYKQDDNDEELLEAIHPFAFAARANAEDTPRYHEAMSGPDAPGFTTAMEMELDQLESMEAWDVVPRQKAIDENKKIFDSVWAFRRKRYPDGSVKKLKARLCVRGDQQEEGVDFFETYSPVVGWSTIRLLLVLSILLELETKQVDYTLAFLHAKIDPGTYVEMPRGFEKDGYVFELKRNLYGLRQAPLNFFNHLKDQLEKRGFEPSHDPCLFINKKTGCMLLAYCDDCIIFHKKEDVIDDLIESMRNPKDKSLERFILNVEDDYAGFLGIDIKRHDDGTIELVQTGLIDRILKALNLDNDDVTVRLEPAAKEALGKNEDGPPRKESWSYPSLIGMMLYLASNSRPEIAFAVHQCARFNHCSRLCHEAAVKRIARYLKGTRNQGFIMKPNDKLELEMFADSDFAGLFNVESKDDPVSVRSRTGAVITLSGVPVTWSSKLQTEIATSTMHAEYIALSTAMRDLIPITNTLNDICNKLNIEREQESKIVRVFEDNEGAMKLANSPLPKVTPQSKHFAVKYHWFRERLDELGVQIKRVDTTLQKADIFTKG
jgi:hypothetical protein